jgi:hydrogenase maturation factor HypF (carbamoyltransferase family)
VQAEGRQHGHHLVTMVEEHAADDRQQILGAVAEHQAVGFHTQLFTQSEAQLGAVRIRVQAHLQRFRLQGADHALRGPEVVLVAAQLSDALQAEALAHGFDG